MKIKFCSIFTVVLISGCSFFSKKDDNRIPVARVFDKYLYLDEIRSIISRSVSSEDSITMANSYVNNWVRQSLILHKAETNLSADQNVFEKQLEDYRRSLIIFEYEKNLVNQLLDTNVSNAEIETYYNNNKQNFELKDNIIKVIFIKVKKDAPNLNKLQKWYKSDAQGDIISLETYCHQYAQNFFLDDNTWLLFDDLLKEVPIVTYNKEDYLKQHTFIELEDSEFKYFVNIKGFKIKNSLSPLSFEIESIRNIIINKRKLELINKMKKDIYEDAEIKNDFEIYKSK